MSLKLLHGEKDERDKVMQASVLGKEVSVPAVSYYYCMDFYRRPTLQFLTPLHF